MKRAFPGLLLLLLFLLASCTGMDGVLVISSTTGPPRSEPSNQPRDDGRGGDRSVDLPDEDEGRDGDRSVDLPGRDDRNEGRDLGRISSNNETVRLQRGTYSGTITITGNRVTLIGAGIGRTRLDGDLIIRGNGARVRNLTILGSVRLQGNAADLTAAEIRGSVRSSSPSNRW